MALPGTGGPVSGYRQGFMVMRLSLVMGTLLPKIQSGFSSSADFAYCRFPGVL
jgi:hypothetical protein